MIGLSIFSGAHNSICRRLMDLLRANGMANVIVLIGGIIPEADIPGLKQAGIAEIFLSGTPTQAIMDFIRERCKRRSAKDIADYSLVRYPPSAGNNALHQMLEVRHDSR